MKNPMLQEDFLFCSLRTEPLIPYLVDAAWLPHEDRVSWYGEGGLAAYQLGVETSYGDKEVFVFSVTDMTSEYTADRFLRWAALGDQDRIIIAAPEFSANFMNDLTKRRNPPVHFIRAHEDEPWFVRITPGETR